MQVIKRNGEYENVDFNKITIRLSKLIKQMNSQIDPIIVAQKVCNAIHDKITTHDLDELASEISISLSTIDPDYGKLAAYIIISDLQKQSKSHSFIDITKQLYAKNFVSDEYLDIVNEHLHTIDKHIDYSKDFDFDYFAIKTLQKSYLYKINKNTIECPQDLFMRVSIGIHGNDIVNIIKSYNLLSSKYFIHATPTLFNSGSNKPQLASCFLMGMEDNIDSIYKTLSDCAKISKWAGGIGLWIHDIRSTGSSIRGIKGASSGIVPMLKVFNDTARYVNQEGKRPGSFAIYLSIEHPDIFDFLDLRKNTGDEEVRARDLFYGIWISDLFMKRVQENGKWSLFCPHICPGLSDVYGTDYENLYLTYESKNMASRVINAQELWFAICTSQIETGTPYILYKDSINNKSNQKNLGTIKSSNLCCEIVEFTSPDEVAVCNLASICLPTFVENNYFNFQKLQEVVQHVTFNLNKVIDRSWYPIPETKTSNTRHRPIGIGVQGLSDVFMLLKYPFDSPEAKTLNKQIFECMYFSSLTESNNLAKLYGPYSSFVGSPASNGTLQFDMWNITPSTDYDWTSLKSNIKQHGLRNSLLLAPMPTATTAQIMGNNECFEPITSNIYLRRTSAGEFVVLNKYLVKDLQSQQLWSKQMKDLIIANHGSIQNINNISQETKNLYKTSWELSQRTLIDLAADRGAFICQSQSLNLFIPNPSIKILTSMHFHSWKQGLKTGIYYLRTKPAANPIQFTIDPTCEACSA